MAALSSLAGSEMIYRDKVYLYPVWWLWLGAICGKLFNSICGGYYEAGFICALIGSILANSFVYVFDLEMTLFKHQQEGQPDYL